MNAIRKIIIAIIIAVAASMVCGAVSVNDFTDIPKDWSQTPIEHAIANGLLMGDEGLIKPQNTLTRAQMAAIVNRAFGSTVKANIAAFQDVDSQKWYYADMAKAVQMGTFVGAGNKLNPDSSITRQEAFLVLARAFKMYDGNAAALDGFSDKDSISSWATGAISAMKAAGYVNGANGKLNPLANITRAEFAQIMDNMLKGYINAEGTYTSLPSGNIMINVPNVTLKGVTITGDLVIGDGVGDGDITLDSVTVTGVTVIRGGGVNSIRITGNSNMDSIIIARVDGEIRVYAEDGTQIGEIIADGKDDVTIEGTVGSVTVMANDVTVTATNAVITSASIRGGNSNFVVAAGSTVNTVSVNAANANVQVSGQVTNIQTTQAATRATINVSTGARVNSVVVNSTGANVSGLGSVGNVTANANNVAVTTPNTTVSAAAGTTGVTAGTTTVTGGTTGNSGNPPAGGFVGGGGGGPSQTLSGIRVTLGSVSKTFSLQADVLVSLGQINLGAFDSYFTRLNTMLGGVYINGESITTPDGWEQVNLIFTPDTATPLPIDDGTSLSALITNYKAITSYDPAAITSNSGFTVGSLDIVGVLQKLSTNGLIGEDMTVLKFIELFGSNVTVTIGGETISITPVYE